MLQTAWVLRLTPAGLAIRPPRLDMRNEDPKLMILRAVSALGDKAPSGRICGYFRKAR